MSCTFTPSPAYRVFLAHLLEARIARGHSVAQLSEIIGPFLVAGDVDGGFRSLSPFELENTLDTLCPEIGQEQFATIIATLDGGMEMWN